MAHFVWSADLNNTHVPASISLSSSPPVAPMPVILSMWHHEYSPSGFSIGRKNTRILLLCSPDIRSSTLFPTNTDGPGRQVFEKQAEVDWERFLEMRGKELKPGEDK